MCVSIIAVSGSFVVCLILDMLPGLESCCRLPNFRKVENIHQVAERCTNIINTGQCIYLPCPSMSSHS
jgi:hypothetical protein